MVSLSSSARLLPFPLLQSFIRPFSSSATLLRGYSRRSSPIAAAFSQASQSSHAVREGQVMEAPRPSSRRPWKPTCLYYTQGKCAMMKDAMHLEKFSHNLMVDLPVNASATDKVKPQKLDYLLILDLEGKVEILEFPVVMIDAQSMEFIDSFHRFVRPTAMSEHRIREYIEGKYGKFGVDRVWHDTAIHFKEVLQEFEDWIGNHNLWKKEQGGSLNNAAFVTCGNWDLKTKVPEQCKVSKIKLPTYFMEWINLKDIYLNFYCRRATGMMTMMRELQLPIVGSHHLGIDDSKNIARVVQHMLADGAMMQITAKRQSATGDVKFLFKDRIR
ncbi:putative exonuclease domain-containing protein [Dichanthelium oligosanthes]|uniref:Putative exonuclease domain-containing protein n=1 Tax=Dichanthelium oligosanthes TaxID=888268 RepID=A0A1E5VDR9_9POAL|nr:putative exonuclease domain-containing protein [Dichanthelium oligosanthes]